ncbi:MAG: hypothetical protein AB8C84_10690 [Oligoflexales bacterium]
MPRLEYLLLFLFCFISCDKDDSPTKSIDENGGSWIHGDWHGLLHITPINNNQPEIRTVDIRFQDDTGGFTFSSKDGGEAEGLWYEDQENNSLLFDIQKSSTSLLGRSGVQKSFQYILSGQTLKLQSEQISIDLRRPIIEAPDIEKPKFKDQQHFHCFDYDASLVWVFELNQKKPRIDVFRMTSSQLGYQENFMIEDQSDTLVTINLNEHKPPLTIHLTPVSAELYQQGQNIPLRNFGCVAMNDTH